MRWALPHWLERRGADRADDRLDESPLFVDGVPVLRSCPPLPGTESTVISVMNPLSTISSADQTVCAMSSPACGHDAGCATSKSRADNAGVRYHHE